MSTSKYTGAKWLRISLVVFSVIILIYGVFLRTSNITSEPYWMDEGYTINAVLSYANGQIDGISAVLDSGRKYECFLYCFPTSIIVNQFGFNQFNYRILSVVFGFISILVLYFLTRLILDQKIALLAALFMNFSYFQIAWSMQARWYTMFTAFFWLAILFFIKSISKSKDSGVSKAIWPIISTVIFTVLAMMSQKIGVVLPTFFALYLIILCFKNENTNKKKIVSIAILIVLAGIALDILSGQNLIRNFIGKINFNYNLPYYSSFFLREYLVFIPFAIYAIIANKSYARFLASLFLIYLIPLSFMTNIVHYRYMFHLTPIFFILGGVGFVEALKDVRWNSKFKEPIGITLFIIAFFVSGAGVVYPQNRYFLESDNPEILQERPSYAYTPQPDWNSAYEYIKVQKNEGELVISSHPHFNKIFLGEAGYWIKYDYLGIDDRTQYSNDDREYYVNAKIIDDLNELKETIKNNHGYIVFDYMSIDGKISEEIVDYINANAGLVFNKKDNSYSEVWVFRF